MYKWFIIWYWIWNYFYTKTDKINYAYHFCLSTFKCSQVREFITTADTVSVKYSYTKDDKTFNQTTSLTAISSSMRHNIKWSAN